MATKPVRTLADCEDHHERKLVTDVERTGWALVGIPPDAEGPGYVFTIGLEHTFGHPELLVFGLSNPRAMALLNAMGEEIRAGRQFLAGQRYADLVENYETRLDAVNPRHNREYLGFCRWFYRGDGFRACQIVWPDPEHRFPEDPEFSPNLRGVQPLLEH